MNSYYITTQWVDDFDGCLRKQTLISTGLKELKASVKQALEGDEKILDIEKRLSNGAVEKIDIDKLIERVK